MYSKELLDSLMPPSSVLEPDIGGFALRVPLGGSFEYSFIPDSEFAKVDPRLPAAIRVFEQQIGEVQRTYVSHIVELWSANCYVETERGDLCVITQVTHVVLAKDSVIITGSCFDYIEFRNPENDEMLLLPVGYGATEVAVTKAWLNKHWPGWAERYHLAAELGMSPEDTLNAMVSVTACDSNVMLPLDATAPE